MDLLLQGIEQDIKPGEITETVHPDASQISRLTAHQHCEVTVVLSLYWHDRP
jgi:hypothetical protein